MKSCSSVPLYLNHFKSSLQLLQVREQILNLQCTLVFSEAVSGLRINLNNSALVAFGENINGEDYAMVLGYNVSKLPLKHLGCPLRARPNDCSIWDSVS